MGSISLITLHVSCYDVAVTFYFVAHVNYSHVSTFPIEQHHIVGGACFGKYWANSFDHFKMVMLRSFTSSR